MASGRPSDTNPEEWYSMAQVVDQNRATNKAFQSAYRGSTLLSRATAFSTAATPTARLPFLLSLRSMRTPSQLQETLFQWMWMLFVNGLFCHQAAFAVESPDTSARTAQSPLTSVPCPLISCKKSCRIGWPSWTLPKKSQPEPWTQCPRRHRIFKQTASEQHALAARQ